ncbi:YbaB/EbfC family nucleoid-associated protein [Flindersiella endophytica]
MQTGESRSLGERILYAQRELSAQLFTAEDRRKVLRITVDGTQRVKTVDLDPCWAKSIQSQNLAREVFACHMRAREDSAAAAETVYATAGLDNQAASDAGAVIRTAVDTIPEASDLIRRLQAETVRSERARGAVAAEFDLRGEPHRVDIRARHATEVEPARLAADICAVLQECGEAAVSRRVELASGLTDGRSFEDRAQERLEEFNQTLAALRARLP